MLKHLTALTVLLAIGLTAVGGRGQSDKPLSILHILHIPAFSDFALSPDGTKVAVTASAFGKENVFVIADPEERGVPAVGTEDRARYRQPDWSPDGKSLTFVSDREEGWHVFTAIPGTDETKQITRHQGDDRQPRWSPDGKHIAYLSQRLGGETGWDVWMVASEGGQPRRLTKHSMDEEGHRWSPDGKWIAYTFNAGRHVNRRIGLVSTEADEEPLARSVLPESWDGDSYSPRWSPDGQRLAFVSDQPGIATIYTVPVEGGEPEQLVDSNYEERDPAWNPKGTEIAHITNREGNLRLSITSIATRKTRLMTLGSGVRSHPQWTKDGEAVACFYEGPNYPRNVWLFQKSGGRSRMTNTLPEDLDVRQFIHPELVRYESFDGRNITGFLYMPPEASADNPATLVVHPHGGPTSQWKNGWHPFVQLLTQRGFAIFAPNVRGSTGFGLEFEDLNDKDWGRGDLEDLIIGARQLRRRPEIREDRAGIWGVSYGGFLTLAAISRYPDFFVCAIESVGMTDLEKLYRETNTEGRTYLERELGPLRGNLQLYRDLSPARDVDKIKTPLLTFHGEDYPLVPLSTKIPFLRALKVRPNYPLQDYIYKGDWARSTYRFDIYPGGSQLYMEKIFEFIKIYL